MKNLAQNIIVAVAGLLGLVSDRAAYRPAHCGNIRTLLLHLCDMDEQMCMWALRWIAFQLRNPGAKMTTALVINGKHPGKTLFFEDVLDLLFGDGLRVILSNQLHDRFTSWAAAPASLVIAHGVFSPRNAARLKSLITSESIMVERRGAIPQRRPNYLNFIFLSGSRDFLRDDTGDRRFAVVETPPAWPRSFLEAVKAEIDEGGVHDFLEYLMRDLDMGTFNESTLPPQPAIHADRSAA